MLFITICGNMKQQFLSQTLNFFVPLNYEIIFFDCKFLSALIVYTCRSHLLSFISPLFVSRVTHPLMTHQNWLKSKLETLSQVCQSLQIFLLKMTIGMSFALTLFTFIFFLSLWTMKPQLFLVSLVCSSSPSLNPPWPSS